MFLSSLLSGMLQFATRRSVAPNEASALPPAPAVADLLDNARVLPAMGRARVPLKNMPRVWEVAKGVDGPTERLIRPGDPGVNAGASYVRPDGVIGRARPSDANQMPARFTRQQVA
ncbi:hypothetical protein [Micromonospora sp. NPDC050695]|uniref:hypothetical protein n=1 Tax=Micromonospora sp. NPDC050695 TaxID=3154938 RepID=UPI003404B30C